MLNYFLNIVFMLNIIPPQKLVDYVKCPFCYRSLTAETEYVKCQTCNKIFLIYKDIILNLIEEANLDLFAINELIANQCYVKTNSLNLSIQSNDIFLWKDYYSQSRKKSIQYLSHFIKNTKNNTIFFMGSGSGKEIQYLLNFLSFKTAICIDLSLPALSLIPVRLQNKEINLGLIASDIRNSIIIPKNIPIVFTNVLHHTQDMHNVLEKYLTEKYQHILFIEPLDNFFISFLSAFGISKRIEYSGIKPGRLNIKLIRNMCKKYGYGISIKTLWSFPQDYYHKLFGNSIIIQKLFFLLINLFSDITNFIKFGNVCIGYLKKK